MRFGNKETHPPQAAEARRRQMRTLGWKVLLPQALTFTSLAQ
jgi:hypothetical protein